MTGTHRRMPGAHRRPPVEHDPSDWSALFTTYLAIVVPPVLLMTVLLAVLSGLAMF
jgi:hypothetical protein